MLNTFTNFFNAILNLFTTTPRAYPLIACLLISNAAMGIEDPSSNGRLTKVQVKAMLTQFMSESKDFQSDSLEAEAAMCLFNDELEARFPGKNTLSKTDVLSILEGFKSGLQKDDPKYMLKLIRCMANSKAMERAANEGSVQPSVRSKAMNMDDFRVDIASLEGKKVRVEGIGSYFMDIFLLKKGKTDMNAVFVDITRLPREQRREILSQCGDSKNNCQLVIEGIVGQVNFQRGLIAERIEWR